MIGIIFKKVKHTWIYIRELITGKSPVKIVHEKFNDNWDLHAVNEPAILWDDGDYIWLLNGKRHRYYGPALSWAGKNWYIKGDWVKYEG